MSAATSPAPVATAPALSAPSEAAVRLIEVGCAGALQPMRPRAAHSTPGMARSGPRGSARHSARSQVTRIVIRDHLRLLQPVGSPGDRAAQETRDVEHALRTPPRAPVVRPQTGILVHRGAAPRRIRDHGIDVARRGVQIAPREFPRRAQVACVPGEPAAAVWPPARPRPRCCEHLDRRHVEVRITPAARTPLAAPRAPALAARE